MSDDDLTETIRGALEREQPSVEAILEQIVGDPTTPAATRVSAAKTLHGIRADYAEAAPKSNAINDYFDSISDEQLDRELDQLFAPSFLESFTGKPSHWPQLAALVDAEVERRVAERLKALRAVRKIEREREKVEGEIERRATLLAQQKYANREFELVPPPGMPSNADDEAATDEPATEAKKTSKPPDTSLGWNDTPRRRRTGPRFV